MAVGGFPPAPYLGVAEVYFDSVEVAAGMGEDPNYRDYAGADEVNFIDQSKLAFLFCAERVVLAGPALAAESPEIKAMLLLKRTQGLTPQDFRNGVAPPWRTLRLSNTPEMSRYVQCTALPEMYASGEPAFDAIVEEMPLAEPCRLRALMVVSRRRGQAHPRARRHHRHASIRPRCWPSRTESSGHSCACNPSRRPCHRQ